VDTRQVFGSKEVAWVKRPIANFCTRCGSKLEDQIHYGELRRVCSSCGFVHYLRPGAAVAVVVVQDDRVLLCKRANQLYCGGLWCLPSGAIELNEDFLTAGLRETEEETGVRVEIKGLLSVVSNFWDDGNSTLVPVLLAEPVGGTPVPTAESEAVAWFNPNELPDMAFEADRHIVERYFASGLSGAPIDSNYARHDASGPRGLTTPPIASRFHR
jgi:8-oxo-dGTP pyrophosphatase MutT (NUDIX family)